MEVETTKVEKKVDLTPRLTRPCKSYWERAKDPLLFLHQKLEKQ